MSGVRSDPTSDTSSDFNHHGLDHIVVWNTETFRVR